MRCGSGYDLLFLCVLLLRFGISDSYVDLSATLEMTIGESLCFLRLVSYLWNVGFLFVRLFSYFYNDSHIVISTGGSFCFRSGEIFLKAMELLGFIFFINCFIFLMATNGYVYEYLTLI